MISKIVGYGLVAPTRKSKLNAIQLMENALIQALRKSSMSINEIDALISMPSLSDSHFMIAHHLATQMEILPKKDFIAKTLDVGGASPVSALIEADRLIREQNRKLVAIVAGDAVGSMPSKDFLSRADHCCSDIKAPSPVIPLGYNSIAEWHIQNGWITRNQLAMVAVLMNRQAKRHPMAISSTSITLDEVLQSKKIGSVTTLLECANRVDGGACLLVASSDYAEQVANDTNKEILSSPPIIKSGGEASGPLWPPKTLTEEMFSSDVAIQRAYTTAGMKASNIQFFGLYDCFPICFIRALESAQLAPKYRGGEYVEYLYDKSEKNGGILPPDEFPVNTHGGLLAFGAPWEVPAMYSIIEAVEQLNGQCGTRQVSNVENALIYGNGGIFSSSSAVIIGK
jgi:acetyl-CoA acetyltransferase